MAEASVEVLVVGAGPTGLMLANWLTKLGVSVAIVDPKAGPTRESRALVLQARTMEIYDQLGIVDTVLARSGSARSIAPGFEKQQFGTIPIGKLGAGVSRYAGLYVLEQSRNEEILYANLQSLGGDVLWGRSIATLGTEGTNAAATVVVATLDGDTGVTTIRARFCVGADGSNSLVRRLRGVPFDGSTNQHHFYVCDATEVKGLRDESINLRPGRYDFLLTFPMGLGGHHRLLGIVRLPRPDLPMEVVEKAVRIRLRKIYGVTWGESRWFSTYRVQHRIAATFRDGPFFIAGDAAHVHSPVGAQGMNTGLQDAHNLALKLVDVVRGRASVASLDRYDAERRPVARRLIRTTDRLFGAVTSDRFLLRLLRRVLPAVIPVAIRIIPRLPGASRLFGYVSQVRIHYWMSETEKAESGGRRDPVVGRRLPWSGDNFATLKSAEWQVHEYGGIDADVAAEVSSGLGVPVRTFPPAPATRLESGLFYLVRPDGFVAAKAAPADAVATLRVALPDQFFVAP